MVKACQLNASNLSLPTLCHLRQGNSGTFLHVMIRKQVMFFRFSLVTRMVESSKMVVVKSGFHGLVFEFSLHPTYFAHNGLRFTRRNQTKSMTTYQNCNEEIFHVTVFSHQFCLVGLPGNSGLGSLAYCLSN